MRILVFKLPLADEKNVLQFKRKGIVQLYFDRQIFIVLIETALLLPT